MLAMIRRVLNTLTVRSTSGTTGVDSDEAIIKAALSCAFLLPTMPRTPQYPIDVLIELLTTIFAKDIETPDATNKALQATINIMQALEAYFKTPSTGIQVSSRSPIQLTPIPSIKEAQKTFKESTGKDFPLISLLQVLYVPNVTGIFFGTKQDYSKLVLVKNALDTIKTNLPIWRSDETTPDVTVFSMTVPNQSTATILQVGVYQRTIRLISDGKHTKLAHVSRTFDAVFDGSRVYQSPLLGGYKIESLKYDINGKVAAYKIILQSEPFKDSVLEKTATATGSSVILTIGDNKYNCDIDPLEVDRNPFEQKLEFKFTLIGDAHESSVTRKITVQAVKRPDDSTGFVTTVIHDVLEVDSSVFGEEKVVAKNVKYRLGHPEIIGYEILDYSSWKTYGIVSVVFTKNEVIMCTTLILKLNKQNVKYKYGGNFIMQSEGTVIMQQDCQPPRLVVYNTSTHLIIGIAF